MRFKDNKNGDKDKKSDILLMQMRRDMLLDFTADLILELATRSLPSNIFRSMVDGWVRQKMQVHDMNIPQMNEAILYVKEVVYKLTEAKSSGIIIPKPKIVKN